MSTAKPRILLRPEYERAAEAYVRTLPLEHFMEATPQGTQRAISLASLALVKVRRPDVHVYNELVVQFPEPPDGIGRVVPDNMVVIHPQPPLVVGSYDIPFQTARPFLVLEYVSKSSQRKDYEESFQKYERDLKVPYYLLFYPDDQELTLYRHNRKKYVSVKPNAAGRLTIPELELEVAILDGWMRYWFRGELLPLPEELLRTLDDMRCQLAESKRQTDEERQRAEEQSRLANEESQRADAESRRAADALLQADVDRQARLAVEQEMAQLRAQLAQLRAGPKSTT